jgi:hypothetical protein
MSSLVGSEWSISAEKMMSMEQERGSPSTTPTIDTSDSYPDPPGSLYTPGSEDVSCTFDSHPALSPHSPAESLFLGKALSSSSVSASYLAQQLHEKHSHFPSSSSRASAVTDDFHSAYDEQEDSPRSDPPVACDFEADEADTVFAKDALSRETYLDTIDSPRFHDSKQDSMTDKISPAEKTYDAAKGVWSWGKGVGFVAPILGFAEDMAAKAVAKAGSTVEDLDGNIVEKLHALDEKLNPAIASIVAYVLGAAASSEEYVKPYITMVLKPLGMIKPAAAEPAPEVTPTSPVEDDDE